MILIACLECHLGIRVMGDPFQVDYLVGRQSDFWPENFICPRCGEKAKGMLEVEASPLALSQLDLRDLTPDEAFVAFQGSGLPEERKCTKDLIQDLFQSPVRRIGGHDTRTDRFILEHIEFWDGTKLYLGAAPGGAIVYKISSPPNYSGSK